MLVTKSTLTVPLLSLIYDMKCSDRRQHSKKKKKSAFIKPFYRHFTELEKGIESVLRNHDQPLRKSIIQKWKNNRNKATEEWRQNK